MDFDRETEINGKIPRQPHFWGSGLLLPGSPALFHTKRNTPSGCCAQGSSLSSIASSIASRSGGSAASATIRQRINGSG